MSPLTIEGGAEADAKGASNEQMLAFCVRALATSRIDERIQQLVARTRPADMFPNMAKRTTVFKVRNPLETPEPSRVTLLGDAAHPMTSHRGLGANTAFADAADLADALCKPDYLRAVQEYNGAMFSRGKGAVDSSLQSTNMLITQSALAANVSRYMLRFIAYILSWQS